MHSESIWLATGNTAACLAEEVGSRVCRARRTDIECCKFLAIAPRVHNFLGAEGGNRSREIAKIPGVDSGHVAGRDGVSVCCGSPASQANHPGLGNHCRNQGRRTGDLDTPQQLATRGGAAGPEGGRCPAHQRRRHPGDRFCRRHPGPARPKLGDGRASGQQERTVHPVAPARSRMGPKPSQTHQPVDRDALGNGCNPGHRMGDQRGRGLQPAAGVFGDRGTVERSRIADRGSWPGGLGSARSGTDPDRAGQSDRAGTDALFRQSGQRAGSARQPERRVPAGPPVGCGRRLADRTPAIWRTCGDR